MPRYCFFPIIFTFTHACSSLELPPEEASRDRPAYPTRYSLPFPYRQAVLSPTNLHSYIKTTVYPNLILLLSFLHLTVQSESYFIPSTEHLLNSIPQFTSSYRKHGRDSEMSLLCTPTNEMLTQATISNVSYTENVSLNDSVMLSWKS